MSQSSIMNTGHSRTCLSLACALHELALVRVYERPQSTLSLLGVLIQFPFTVITALWFFRVMAADTFRVKPWMLQKKEQIHISWWGEIERRACHTRQTAPEFKIRQDLLCELSACTAHHVDTENPSEDARHTTGMPGINAGTLCWPCQ